MLFKRILLTVGFIVLFFSAVSWLDMAHSTERLSTPACSPLEDLVNSETIQQGRDGGGDYVRLDGDDAKHVSDRIQAINNEPLLQVDRLDFLFFPSGAANLVTSYSGCTQAADHLHFDRAHMEQFRLEGKL